MKLSWTRSSRLPRIPLWAVLIGCLWGAGVVAGTRLSAATGGDVGLCWFKTLTRLPCPSCGATRAVQAAAEGRLLDAWVCNPLLVSAGAAMMLWLVVRLVTGRRLGITMGRREQVLAWSAGAALLLANWVFLIRQGR
jgi:hypothetical protein